MRFDSHAQKDLIQRVVEPMASDGLRTICLAYKDYVPAEARCNENQVIFGNDDVIDWLEFISFICF